MPIKLKCLIIVMSVCFVYNKANAQFITLYQKTNPNYFYTIIEPTTSTTFKVINNRTVIIQNAEYAQNQLLTIDFNGNITDSLNFEQGFSTYKTPVRVNNSIIWAFVYSDSVHINGFHPDAYIFKFDTNYNYVSKTKLTPTQHIDTEIPSNVVAINNKLYVAVRNYNNAYTKLYKLDTAFTKLDSAIFNGVVVSELQTVNNQLLIAGSGFNPASVYGNAQKVIMDTTLQVVSVFNLDSVKNISIGCAQNVGIQDYCSKVIPITSTKHYVTGNYRVIYNANCNMSYNMVNVIMDNNNALLNTQLIADAKKNVLYMGETNYVSFKYNTLYTVGISGYIFSTPALLHTEHTPIVVTKLDTNGAILWSKKYGGDMFYSTTSIVTTLDSGVLISGIRYDSANTQYPNVGESFILKLDKNGNTNLTALQTNTVTYSSMYPNPASISINVGINTKAIQILDMSGRIVYEDKAVKTPLVNIEHLTKGMYLVKTTNGANTTKIEKLIKE